jgi:hypothetical protein
MLRKFGQFLLLVVSKRQMFQQKKRMSKLTGLNFIFVFTTAVKLFKTRPCVPEIWQKTKFWPVNLGTVQSET